MLGGDPSAVVDFDGSFAEYIKDDDLRALVVSVAGTVETLMQTENRPTEMRWEDSSDGTGVVVVVRFPAKTCVGLEVLNGIMRVNEMRIRRVWVQPEPHEVIICVSILHSAAVGPRQVIDVLLIRSAAADKSDDGPRGRKRGRT